MPNFTAIVNLKTSAESVGDIGSYTIELQQRYLDVALADFVEGDRYKTYADQFTVWQLNAEDVDHGRWNDAKLQYKVSRLGERRAPRPVDSSHSDPASTIQVRARARAFHRLTLYYTS